MRKSTSFACLHTSFASEGRCRQTTKGVVYSGKIHLIKIAKLLNNLKRKYKNSPRSIYSNSNMTPRLSFRDKIPNFSLLHCLAVLKRDLSTKKTKPNIEKLPENLGVMLEF